MHPDSVRFPEPITYTELTPRLLSWECETWLANYKETLLAELLDESGPSIPRKLLTQAVNEADSLASLTPFPALFLPALVEEKVSAAKVWLERQRQLLGGSEIALSA